MSVRSSLGSRFGKQPEVESKGTGFMSVVSDPRLTIEERIQIFGLSRGVALPPISKEAKARKKEFMDRQPPPTGPKDTGFFATHGISFPKKQPIGQIRDTAITLKERNKKQKEEARQKEIKSNPNLSNKILTSPDVKKTKSVKKTFSKFSKSVPRLGDNLKGKLEKLTKLSNDMLDRDFKRLFTPKSKSVPRLGKHKKSKRRK